MGSELTLYGIVGEIRDLYDIIEESGGEITEEVESALALTQENLALKSESYISLIQHYEGLANLAKEREEQILAIARTYESKARMLRERLSGGLRQIGVDKLETPCAKVSFRKSKKVVIDDENAVDRRFVTTKTTEVISKTAIKEALESGEAVSGAHIEETLNMVIK